MSKNSLIILIALQLVQIPVLAFSLGDLIGEIDNRIKTYPEVRKQKIYFNTGKSPLAALETIEDKTKREFEKAKQSQERLVTFSAANKIFGLADGFINVKFQVQDGVKNALKDIFIGYPEYQRRKITEEITNANINSHLALLEFIYKFNFKDYFSNLFINNDSQPHQSIYRKLKSISLSLLIIISLIKLLESFFLQENIVQERLEIILKKFILCFLLLISLDQIWLIILNFCLALSEHINGLNIFMENKLDYFILVRNLISSWENLLNKIGYFPAIILSIIDTSSHFIFYSIITLTSLILILIKICSPILVAKEILNNRNKIQLSYFYKFIKIAFLFILFPVFIKINYFITSNIDINNLKYLNIIYSINLFLAISIIFLWALTSKTKND